MSSSIVIGALDWEACKRLYQCLLYSFDHVILPTYACCHVQFLLFYICSFKEVSLSITYTYLSHQSNGLYCIKVFNVAVCVRGTCLLVMFTITATERRLPRLPVEEGTEARAAASVSPGSCGLLWQLPGSRQLPSTQVRPDMVTCYIYSIYYKIVLHKYVLVKSSQVNFIVCQTRVIDFNTFSNMILIITLPVDNAFINPPGCRYE